MSLPLFYALVQEADDPFRDSPYLRIDPEKIVLDARDARTPCGECHALEYGVWEETSHATGFDELHRRERAQEILDNLDLNSTKRASLCLRCHYTAVGEGEAVKAIAGVSCESCHGAARDWIEVHNDYGTQGQTVEVRRSLETDAHREARIQASLEGGMLRPSTNLYAVAANCFECHTVPNEELVNVGGHVAGSGSFNFLQRLGEIQHNFLEAQWSDDQANREPLPERQRLMFMLGRLLDYEYSIRGMAEATEAGKYAKSMERRVKRAYRDLEAAYTAAPTPEVAEVLRLGGELGLTPGNERRLLAAAERISQAGQRFAHSHDGTDLAALDALISGASAPPVAEAEDLVEAANAAAEAASAAGAPTLAEPAAGAGAAPASAGGGATPVEAAVVTADDLGPIRRRPAWFESDGPYETMLPGCGCHSGAEDWWYEDEHFASSGRLLNEEPRAVEIASAYGLSAAQMKRGDQMCMSCHGTVVTGAVDVSDGVSCESCHGPSSGYLDPHTNGGNPQLGMRALKEPAVRAANCARCHLVTDARLLAAGHPSGEGYDVVAGNDDITHWPGKTVERKREGPYPVVSDDALAAAFRTIAQNRPVPDVPDIRTPAASAAPTASAVAPTASAPSGTPRAAAPRQTTRAAPPSRGPVRRAPRIARQDLQLDLPPRTPVTDSTSTEDVLLIIKRRLDALHQAVGSN